VLYINAHLRVPCFRGYIFDRMNICMMDARTHMEDSGTYYHLRCEAERCYDHGYLPSSHEKGEIDGDSNNDNNNDGDDDDKDGKDDEDNNNHDDRNGARCTICIYPTNHAIVITSVLVIKNV